MYVQNALLNKGNHLYFDGTSFAKFPIHVHPQMYDFESKESIL